MTEDLVILPTYNERENIAPLVEAIFTHSPSVHVVIVDDASPDGTGAVAESLAKVDARVHIIHRTGKLGLGSAYIAGFRYGLTGPYQYFVHMDADLSHNPRDIPHLLARARTGSDLVIGSRLLPDSRREKRRIHRRLLSRIGNLYARGLLDLHVRDLTTGFRCVRRRVLEAVNLDALHSDGYLFLIQTAYLFSRQGFQLEEVPIVFVDRRFGKSKFCFKDAAKTIGFVWHLWRDQDSAKSKMARPLRGSGDGI